MFCKLSIINDLFDCYNLPIVILNSNFSIISKHNYNDDITNILNKFPILNELKSLNFKPSILSFKYDNINFTCILFYNCYNTPLYFLIGPYKLKNNLINDDNNIISIKENSLKEIIKLYNNILNYNFSNNENSYSPLVSNAIKYIEENYSNPITIDTICNCYNINKCYFCNLFKKETGLTFINYLNNYKVEKSKELLKDLSLSILDISLAVGFNNQSYYSTIFRKITDLTPLEYRSNIVNINNIKKECSSFI